MICIFCKSKKFEVKKFENVNSIASDENQFVFDHQIYFYTCRNCSLTQKKVSKDYINRCKKIYSKYNLYVDNEENKIYKNKFNSRSEIIIDNVLKKFKKIKKEKLKILDFGSGNCNLITGFKKFEKNIDFYSFDITKPKKIHKGKIGLKKYFTKDFNLIKIKFDCIILQHSFEHLINPKQTIKALLKKLTYEGFIYIQSPDLNRKKLDLFTYDHVFHLTKVSSYNFSILINKKIQFNNNYYSDVSFVLYNKAVTKKNLRKTNSKIKLVDLNSLELKVKDYKDLYIFSASGNSFFLTKFLNKKIINYIDDDKKKIGKSFIGKKVIEFQRMKKDIPCIVLNKNHINTKTLLTKKKLIKFY